jgi:hypothetical protein
MGIVSMADAAVSVFLRPWRGKQKQDEAPLAEAKRARREPTIADTVHHQTEQGSRASKQEDAAAQQLEQQQLEQAACFAEVVTFSQGASVSKPPAIEAGLPSAKPRRKVNRPAKVRCWPRCDHSSSVTAPVFSCLFPTLT